MITPAKETQFPVAAAQLERVDGFDFSNAKNLVWVSATEIAYVNGRVIALYDVVSGEQRVLQGRDSGGVGCVEVDPTGTWLAVAERVNGDGGARPRVFIYELSTMKLHRILRKGAVRGYRCVTFSPHDPDQLATLGDKPDYLLTIWDWKQEKITLKYKAFSQDIFQVRWGQFPGQLITTGVGHIRFWKMATTFSGLKLQGALGKFGGCELSDIRGYCELPDGKVVSGTEYGKLLLWEGVHIKVEIITPEEARSENMPANGHAHTGQLNVVLWEDGGSTDTRFVISAGEDGYIRWWPWQPIDYAEADYDSGTMDYSINMAKELMVPQVNGQNANIQHIAVSADKSRWTIQDARNGVIWHYTPADGEFKQLFSCHSAAVRGVVSLPSLGGAVVSASDDGTLRLSNPTEDVTTQKTTVLSCKYSPIEEELATMLVLPPDSVDPTHKTIVCGYTSGVARVFTLFKDKFLVRQAVKPHANKAIVNMKFSPDGKCFASIGAANNMFFFQVSDSPTGDLLLPIGFG